MTIVFFFFFFLVLLNVSDRDCSDCITATFFFSVKNILGGSGSIIIKIEIPTVLSHPRLITDTGETPRAQMQSG